MTPEQERAQAALYEVDRLARDLDIHEFGLPFTADATWGQMIQMIANAIGEAVAEEREACARIAATSINGFLPETYSFPVFELAKQEIAVAIRARATPAENRPPRPPPANPPPPTS